jgi:hypothetical protein
MSTSFQLEPELFSVHFRLSHGTRRTFVVPGEFESSRYKRESPSIFDLCGALCEGQDNNSVLYLMFYIVPMVPPKMFGGFKLGGECRDSCDHEEGHQFKLNATVWSMVVIDLISKSAMLRVNSCSLHMDLWLVV